MGELQDHISELFLGGVISIVCYVLMYDNPKPFDRVQVRAVRRQQDKMDTTI